jgi:hypothetical protein
MENKGPDRLYVRSKDLDDFKMLLQDRDSPFFKKDNKDVFIMAMIFGYKNGQKTSVEKKEGFFRVTNLSGNEKSLIKALAVNSEGDLRVLLDKQKVFSVAEEYAAGGIKHLKDAVFNSKYGSYVKWLESELVSAYEKLDKDKPVRVSES